MMYGAETTTARRVKGGRCESNLYATTGTAK